MDANGTGSARSAILAAATDLIRVQGVAGTSISHVITRSGTSAGAIYHHFGSKERLILEVSRNAMARPMGMVLRTSPALSPGQLLGAALAQVDLDPHTSELLLQIWAGARSDAALSGLLFAEVEVIRVRIRNHLADWCAGHAPAAQPDQLAELIVGLVMGFAVQRALGLNQDPGAYRSLAAGLLDAAVAAGQEVSAPQ